MTSTNAVNDQTWDDWATGTGNTSRHCAQAAKLTEAQLGWRLPHLLTAGTSRLSAEDLG